MHFYISHVKFAHFWCWSNMNLKLNFFHLLCFDHYSKIPPKNVHSCRFRHTPVFEYYINFLKCSLCNLSMVQFKIHSSFDNNKHINVYRIVHVLAFFFRQIPKCISHQFFKRPSKKWRFQHQSCGSCVPRQDRKSGQVHH